MYHMMAGFAYPCQVRNFVYFVQRQFIVHMVALPIRITIQRSTATTTFTSVAIKGIFPVHKIFEVQFSRFVYPHLNIFWSIDRRSVRLGRRLQPAV